jgi:hypothetical protein
MPLRGKQLSLLPDVSPYLIENLPLPGEMMTTRSGVARVTRLEPLGEEIVIWGDYGSGIEQPHGRENATCNLKIVLGGKAVEPVAIADTSLIIDPLALNFEVEESCPVSTVSSEETVLGGESSVQSATSDSSVPNCGDRACGWIAKKTTARKRKNRDAWVCEQWWLYWEEPGGKKRSRYIPKSKLAEVEQSVYGLKQPIAKTLELLDKKGGDCR